jgi:hypothetical protein
MREDEIQLLKDKISEIVAWQHENPNLRIRIDSGSILMGVEVFQQSMIAILSSKKVIHNKPYFHTINKAHNSMLSKNFVDIKNIKENKTIIQEKKHNLAPRTEKEVIPVMTVVRDEIIDNVEDEKSISMKSTTKTDNSEQIQTPDIMSENPTNISIKKERNDAEKSPQQLNLF